MDVFAGESLRVSGIRYELDENATPYHGVIALESYARREHGATETGRFDYANGRFAHPVPESPLPSKTVLHPGFESGWNLEVIDNRVAVVAIRYFENSFIVEDRMLLDMNVVNRDKTTTWTEVADPKFDVVDPEPDQAAENARAAAGAAAQVTSDTKQGTNEERKAAESEALGAKRITDAAEACARQRRERASRADACIQATTR